MSELTLNHKIISSIEQFAGCCDDWNSVAGDRVFHRWEWMFSWWEAFNDQGTLAIVVIFDDNNRWLGIAPWYKTTSASRGCVVRTLADGCACSDYTSLAICGGFEQQVAAYLAEIIGGSHDTSGMFADVDLFEIEAHSHDDLPAIQLTEHLEGYSLAIQSEEFAATWRIELPSTWTEFEARLHKSFRRKTKKASKRADDPDFEMVVARTPDQIQAYWPTFVDLHQRRQQSIDNSGCFADTKFEQFLQSATLRLAEAGLSQINVVRYQNETLATSLEFVSGDSVLMYQTGMDPEQIKLEPGHIIFTWTIQRSIELGFKWFDFLRGDEPYKSRWKAARVPLYRTQIVPSRLSSKIRFGISSASKTAKNWTKSLLSSHAD